MFDTKQVLSVSYVTDNKIDYMPGQQVVELYPAVPMKLSLTGIWCLIVNNNMKDFSTIPHYLLLILRSFIKFRSAR